MKIAIPIWHNQISNVFDFAGTLLLVEIDNGKEKDRQEVAFSNQAGLEKAATVKQSGAEVLICGAISKPLMILLNSSGVRVLPFITGPIEQVLEAFGEGLLDQQPQFALPGCSRDSRVCPGGRRKRHKRRCQQPNNDSE